MFILDTKKEDIAVTEANKLGIPVVAVVDTNCDPDIIQYVIPGNDDAIRSGDLLTRVIADAVLEGRLMRSKKFPEAAAPKQRTAEEEAERRNQQDRARVEAAAAQAAREARVAAAKDAGARVRGRCRRAGRSSPRSQDSDPPASPRPTAATAAEPQLTRLHQRGDQLMADITATGRQGAARRDRRRDDGRQEGARRGRGRS